MIAKNVNSYLPFYLGCEMLLEKSGRIITLCGFGNDDKQGLQISDGFSWFSLEQFPFKLMLRPLSDMAEMEGVHIAEMAMHSYLNLEWFRYAIQFNKFPREKPKFTFKKYAYDTDNDGEYWKVEMDIADTPLMVNIWEDFNVQVHDEDIMEVSNQIKISEYLIRRGFDVFGLIKLNSAVDKTKF